MSFGTSVTFNRRKKGMQAQHLAESTGIPLNRIQMFEHNSESPTLTEALAIAKVLDVSLRDLDYLGGNDSSTEQSLPAPQQIGPPTFEDAVKWGQQHQKAKPSQEKTEPTTRTFTPEGKKAFGEKIKKAREAQKVSYAKIKEALGIEIIDYLRIERGQYEQLNDELIAKLIRLFNLKFN